MILLLLTSALALSFVPLTSNDLPVVTISAVAFTPAVLGDTPAAAKLTATLTSDIEGSTVTTHDFRVVVYAGLTGGKVLFSEDVLPAQLTVAEATLDIEIEMDESLVGLDTIHVDILAKLKAEPNTESSILKDEARIPVAFAAKKVSVVVAPDTNDVKFTFTLTEKLADPIGDTKFVFGDASLTVDDTDKADKKYSVTITKVALKAASALFGYFKGTDEETSTLPLWIFDLEASATFAHTDATKAKATFVGLPAGGKVYLKSGGTTTALTLEAGDKCDLTYVQLADAVIYYTDAADVPVSNKLDISLPPFTQPTGGGFVVVDEGAQPPNLKLIFEEADPNRKLIVVKTPANEEISVGAIENDITLDKFVGTAAYFIEKDNAVPKSIPVALPETQLSQTKAAKDGDGNIPVTVEIVANGWSKAVPAGLLVYAKGETDKTKAKFYPLEWSDDEDQAGEATAFVVASDWAATTDKDIESYVCPDYSTTIPVLAEAVKLSEKLVVIKEIVPSAEVTVGTTFAFDPATPKLTVPVKSDKSVTTSDNTFEVVLYDKATNGKEIARADAQAKLDGTEGKSVDVTVVMADMPVDQKAVYVDVEETPEGEEDPFTIIKAKTRIAANFVKVDSVALAKDGEDVKVTITLDAEIPTADLATTKLQFVGQELALTAETTPEKTYSAKVAPAKIKDAASGLAYIKGKDIATSTLQFTVLQEKPVPALKLHSATHAKCDLKAIPAGVKVMLKSGTADAKELTVAEGAHYVEIAYADLKENCILYYANTADVAVSAEAAIAKLAALVAPSAEALVAVEDKLPSLKVTFAAGVENRKLVLVQEEGNPIVVDVSAKDDTIITSDKLVGTDGYYIVTEDNKIPLSEGKALAAATFTQTKAAVEDGKIPVTVEMTKGFYAAEPKGLLVHAEGEEDLTKAKFYELAWGITAETVNKATTDVTVEDFKTLTAKNIESYVAGNYDADKPEDTVKLSAAFIVIAKTEPVEPEPKDEGAFGQMVSLMAVVVSLFVLAL